jgi:hyaluronoglucosaminidase
MQFLSGIVEGFYGREWSWEDRRKAADFLCCQQLNSYLYCPKADSHLRESWQEDWSPAVGRELSNLANHYRSLQLNWGVGLSPYALYRDYSATQRLRLQDKVRRIDDLGGNLLAVLFDDMPGDCPDLAQRQAEIVQDIQLWTGAERLLVCPTYYSHDPVLERYFGPRPANYWEELGAGLPAEADILWTGNLVCSRSISKADVDAIANLVGRPVTLWDNYPVNDGEKASKLLHLQPLSGREPALAECLHGHFCNPMNQAQLSRYPLAGLGALYGAPPLTLEECFGETMADQLTRDMKDFEAGGLDFLGAERREQLARIYAELDHPAAAEVVAWLRGDYRFDPACLTG